MKVLEDTPAALSLGKLCDEHGYSYEWINGQKPHLMKNGIRIQCNTENFVPIVVPGLSTSSSSSSSTSIPMTSSTEIDHSDLPPAIVSSESVERQVRGDPYHSDIPEWLQEFRENLVDDRVPERRDSHASSSHEISLEPRRSVDLGKTQCLYSLPERPKLRDLPEDQNHKGPVQMTHWQSRSSCRKFW